MHEIRIRYSSRIGVLRLRPKTLDDFLQAFKVRPGQLRKDSLRLIYKVLFLKGRWTIRIGTEFPHGL